MDGQCKTSSSFMKEIRTLPVVQAMEDLYTSSKQSSGVLSTGLAVVEYSLGSLSSRFYSSLGSRVDNLAGKGVCRLKEKYPTLHQSPREIKDNTYSTVRSTVRCAMKTFPGRIVIGGLDWMIDRGEGLLTAVTPHGKSPRKDVRGTLQKQHNIQSEHAYASEDSGACDAESEVKREHKSQQTTIVPYVNMNDESMMRKMYMQAVVKPIEKVVMRLKRLRRYLAGKRRSHEKEEEIEKRRKVTPKKKVTSTFLGRIRYRAYSLLGFRPLKGIRLGFGNEGSGIGDAEHKRKYDEIVTDEEATSDEDLENFDYDNYKSDEDPDFESPESADDSDDTVSDEGETEHDLSGLIQDAEKPVESVLDTKKASPKNTKTETEAKENHQEAGGGPQFRPGLSTGDVEV